MQKVSYMGNGSTTEFFFNFPFFENSNVIVTINNTAATGYSIIGTPGGLDADIPYIGGKVVFEVAPTSIDCITIARQLPLERIVDYQPLSKIDPTTLNQDLNYLMEVIKDRKDELADLTTKYAEIADKESTEIILARISAIHDEITDIDAKIRALGDIGTLQQRVTDLTTTVGGHTTSIGALDTTVDGLNATVGGHTTSINGLDTRTTGMIDYVVESQTPTAENNYTWYRKYKSGWVEQGGYIANGTGNYNKTVVNLIVEMANVYYYIDAGIRWGCESNWYILSGGTSQAQVTDVTGAVADITTTSFTLQSFSSHCWTACGMAA